LEPFTPVISARGNADLNLLPIFAAVAEARSVTAAAKRIRVPKSSVSRAIASLESALQTQLFHRDARRVLGRVELARREGHGGSLDDTRDHC
jgi:molybdenum-dependent DNA-binding transcriptional regulator ModE